MTLGVDYPWTHPDPAALQAGGVAFAMRYLSNDPSKNLTRGEADALAACGIWSGVVWETTAARALAGRIAGVTDAQAAVVQAAACGMPASRPIYFAVDTDTTWDRVQAYFDGVSSVIGAARTGVYGGLRIIQGAAASRLVTWFWQASAWSGGVWDPRAHIRQLLASLTIGGVDCDQNVAMAVDFGQWMPGRLPTPPVAPSTGSTPRGDEMASLPIPFGFAFDAAGTLTDSTKMLATPVPELGGPRINYRQVDLSLGCDMGSMRVRIAIHNEQTGWAANRIWQVDLQATDKRYPIWLQSGDDKISIGRVPTSASDSKSDKVPASLLIEPVLA